MSISRFIGIHTLVQAPPGNFNRDDLGQAKLCTLGGVTRCRWSDASQKRNARELLASKAASSLTSIRTSHISEVVVDHIRRGGLSPLSDESLRARVDAFLAPLFGSKSMSNKEAAAERAEKTLNEASEKLVVATESGDAKEIEKAKKAFDKAENDRDKKLESLDSGALVHMATPAVSTLADAILDTTQDDDKGNPRIPSKAEIVEIIGSAMSIDIGAFGRMYAADSSKTLNTDASVQVAHAISTGGFSPDVDFFTAMDDFTGRAGVMDYRYLGAPLMYRYAAIDTVALSKNLSMDVDSDEFREILDLLITSLVHAAPTGRKNGSGSVGKPSTVMITTGDAPTILTAGFVEPVALPKEATERLFDTHAAYLQGYGMDFSTSNAWSLESVEPNTLVELRDSVREVIDRAVNAATAPDRV